MGGLGGTKFYKKNNIRHWTINAQILIYIFPIFIKNLDTSKPNAIGSKRHTIPTLQSDRPTWPTSSRVESIYPDEIQSTTLNSFAL